MKVGIFLIDDLIPAEGGGFSYYEKLINAIDVHRFNQNLEVCFVGRIAKNKIKLRNAYVELSSPALYKLFYVLRKLKIIRLLSKVFSTNSDICNRLDSARLRENKIDIILFPQQFSQEIDNFPFMTMNWDAGHKSTFMFPEFAAGFEHREKWYSIEMQKALAVIVESQASKIEFSEYFAIPQNKIEIVPLFPGGVVDVKVEEHEQQESLKKFGLRKDFYFFYPAQFWAHKNHYNLIIAFKEFLEKGTGELIKLVFTGSDKGNKDYILSVIKEQNLQQNIVVLGFVSNEEVYTLYKNALALVMPTFLGPTNMPVLEAQALQTAVICSDLKGHRETCGEGAVYIDPTNSTEIQAAMMKMLDENFRRELVNKANKVRETSGFNIRDAIGKLESIFLKFIPIRKTFQ